MKKYLALLLVIFFTFACSKGEHKPAEEGESTPEASGNTSASYKVRLGDRYYVANVLYRVFRSTAQSEPDDPNVTTEVQELVENSTQHFGGPCKLYDVNTCGTMTPNPMDPQVFAAEGDINADMVPGTAPPREGLRIRACKNITELDGAIDVALTKAGITQASVPNNGNLLKVFQRFYPGKTPPSQYYKDLAAIHASALSQYNSLDAWRLVFYSVCVSPGWQIP